MNNNPNPNPSPSPRPRLALHGGPGEILLLLLLGQGQGELLLVNHLIHDPPTQLASCVPEGYGLWGDSKGGVMGMGVACFMRPCPFRHLCVRVTYQQAATAGTESRIDSSWMYKHSTPRVIIPSKRIGKTE